MTTEKALREALQAFLDTGVTEYEKQAEVRKLARAALSLPETQGEPVAWMYVWPKNNLPYLTRHIYDERLSVEARAARAAVGVKEFPLYAAPPSQPAQGEPVAWLYTLEYGKAVANKMVSIEKLNYPFGVCGSDYLAKNDEGISYVRQTPLCAAPSSQPAQGGVNLDVISRAYGWTVDDDGMVHGLTSGDMGYEPTGIVLAAAPAAPTQAKPTNGEGA